MSDDDGDAFGSDVGDVGVDVRDDDDARSSDDEDTGMEAMAISMHARANGATSAFCRCPAPVVRNNRDFSGRVCVLCGVSSMLPIVRATFEDVRRERAERAPAKPPPRVPIYLHGALRFLLGPEIRAMVHARHQKTTRRTVAEARRVFNTVGVEYMEAVQAPEPPQIDHLVRGVYRHVNGLHTSEAIEVVVEMVISLPAGPWRDVACIPWMCAMLYTETARQDLVDHLAAFFRRERAAPRDDPGERIRRRTHMFTHRTDEAVEATIAMLVKDEKRRREEEAASGDDPRDASVDTWPTVREAPAGAWRHILDRSGLKIAAAPGGEETCTPPNGEKTASTSTSKRRRG